MQRCVWAMLLTLATAAPAAAQSMRPTHHARWQDPTQSAEARRLDPATLPAGTRLTQDVRYGGAPLETFDVYAPEHAHDAPVIFMVHGGGWQRGDKTARGVVQNKIAHWLPRGFIVVSVDYPMLPDTLPLQQARDVVLALAIAQRDAPRWGGDPHRFVLMGHSAGAHLVALISSEPSLATVQGALPWLGTVALDSAAYDVSTIMRARHLRLYDEAFGNDPATWSAVSPVQQLQSKAAPFLAVCSSRRADSCAQARAFVKKARQFGSRAEVLPEDLRHAEINAQLGLPSDYTASVDAFLASLDSALGALLR